jgi:hypothetical protein
MSGGLCTQHAERASDGEAGLSPSEAPYNGGRNGFRLRPAAVVRQQVVAPAPQVLEGTVLRPGVSHDGEIPTRVRQS